MSPRERIKDLCQRYDVSQAFGDRMLPLAQRAEEVRPELRRRLLAFLERSFLAQAKIEAEEAAAEARKAPAGDAPRATPAEARALRAIAGVLHEWDPPRWLDRWAKRIDAARPAEDDGEKAG